MRARHLRQAKDISELKSQMAQVLEYLVKQQALSFALPPAPAPGPTSPSQAVAPDISEQDVAMSMVRFQCSIRALMERVPKFLQEGVPTGGLDGLVQERMRCWRLPVTHMGHKKLRSPLRRTAT
ncbi:UNVERIFIED_CONTAM: hypothetical protein FKN15_058374 [Acipenser sinensis]